MLKKITIIMTLITLCAALPVRASENDNVFNQTMHKVKLEELLDDIYDQKTIKYEKYQNDLDLPYTVLKNGYIIADEIPTFLARLFAKEKYKKYQPLIYEKLSNYPRICEDVRSLLFKNWLLHSVLTGRNIGLTIIGTAILSVAGYKLYRHYYAPKEKNNEASESAETQESAKSEEEKSC